MRWPRTIAWAGLLAFGALAAVHAAAPGRKHAPSRVLLPDQTIRIAFSHRKHLALGKSCVDCHGAATMSGPGVANSLHARDVNLPLEEVCLTCHDVTRPDAKPKAHCATCHPGLVPDWPTGVTPNAQTTRLIRNSPVTLKLPPPNLKMNHKRHADLGVGCTTCHPKVPQLDLATRDDALPTMGVCLGCHDGSRRTYRPPGRKPVELAAGRACRLCHVTAPDGRVKTNWPEGRLEPAGWYEHDAHDGRWVTGHAASGRMAGDYCASCHRPKDCIGCHSGVKKPLKLHPNDWTLGHVVAARRNSPDCSSCHRSQAFCLDCHMATRVGGDPGGGRPPEERNLRVHPQGWDSFAGRGPNHHSFHAQRNLRACTSCHSEASCLRCHASGELSGRGVNPHPPRFRAKDCVRMRDRKRRVCLKCHAPGSAEMSCR